MPSTRTTDPQTSHDAEKSVSKLAQSYNNIIELFTDHGPMNDAQLIAAWRFRFGSKAAESGIRSRRAELVAAGRIEDSGEKIPMESGRMSIVWRLI